MAKIRRTVLIICSLVILSTTTPLVHAQGSESLVVPADPRSVAMAESFVAVRGNENALMYNPATLAGRSGASFMFAQRNMNWYSGLSGSRYQLFSASAETPWGAVGLIYSRYIMGEMVVTAPANTISGYTEIGTASPYDYMLGIGAAKSLGDHWDIGLTAKMNTQGWTSVTGPISSSSTPAFLMDLGILYRLKGKSETLSAGQELTAGLSIQNFGSVLKTETTVLGTSYWNSLVPSRYLRAGFSYGLTIEPEGEQNLTPFNLTLTGEYRIHWERRNDWMTASNRENYWGFGMESTMYEVLVIRTGGFIQPGTSVYGTANVLALRYGVGLRVPFDRLGMGIPLTFELDYAALPLNTSSVYYITSHPESTLHAFSAGLHYTSGLF